MVFYFYNNFSNESLNDYNITNRFQDEDRETLLKNNIDKLLDNISINTKKINLSNELIYKDLNELIMVKYEPIFVKNYMTGLNNVTAMEWADLLKVQKDYLNKDSRNEFKDKMNEVNDKTSSNNIVQNNKENQIEDVLIIEEISKVDEESKNNFNKSNHSQDDYMNLISKFLPALLEREDKKRKSSKTNNPSKPANKSNPTIEIVDNKFQDDMTLSEEEIPNTNHRPSIDINMLENDEQLSGNNDSELGSDKLRILNVKFISQGFHDNIRKQILKIILNFGIDPDVTDLIHTKFESKLSKNLIQSYLNHFRASLNSNLAEFDTSFYFFNESVVNIKRNIIGIQKLKEFHNVPSGEKSKIVEKIIQKGRLKNNEKSREMISKIITLIYEKGGILY